MDDNGITIASLEIGTLDWALAIAKNYCWDHLEEGDLEEHGGIILKQGDKYDFVYLNNANSGTDIANGLFTADRKEHGSKVIVRFKEGWKQYASYHTHPQFLPYPSYIDMTQLFTGFKHNYIFSGLTGETMKYTWLDDNTALIPELVEFNE